MSRPDRLFLRWMEALKESAVQKKVLVVDDQHVVLETLGAMLTRAGYKVTCVPTGAGALAAARLAAYDAALIDVFMPEMDGFETALRLREQSERRGRTIRLWHMTGRNSPEVERRSAQCGMMGLIVKPFSLEQLCAIIEAGLAAPMPPSIPDPTQSATPSSPADTPSAG